MPLQKTTPQEIIRQSILVFRRKGYYRTNMSDLARATGLTKGAFYHHFSSKEDVMRKALQASTQWFCEKVFCIADVEQLSPGERLDQMAELSFKAFTSGEGGCFFANTVLETAHVEDTFLAEITLFFDSWKLAIQKIYQHKYSAEQLEEVVEQTIADIEGSIVLMQLYKTPHLLQKALDRSRQRLADKNDLP
ncbi:MAG: TetR/AcrR family transcriptional regulator [Bacteroidota bacterium]